MKLEIPDCPATQTMSADALRLELACALYARGHVSAITGGHMAGLDLFAFQSALAERSIPRVSEAAFAGELAALESLPAL